MTGPLRNGPRTLSTAHMAHLDILHHPDPRLRRQAEPVQQVDDAVRRLAADMAQAMYAAQGVGLAATQVGDLRRLIVMDLSAERDQLIVLVNPEISASEGSQVCEEGCLSVPEYRAEVERAERVEVQALGLDGEPLRLEADGLLAVCVQHEIDHLDGRLFIDYLSRLKRERVTRRLEKLRREAAQAGAA